MSEPVPDLYIENVQLGTSPFGMVLSFGKQSPLGTGVQAPIPVCTIRMSLEHAKVMAIMLRKQVRMYEEQMGEPIPLHPQLWTQLGLSRQEDW